MPSLLVRARESETWKAIHDIVALHEIYGLLAGSGLFGVVGGISAWMHGEPLHVILFWAVAIAAVAFFALFLWRNSKKKKDGPRQDVQPIVIPRKNLNLLSSTLRLGVFGLENDIWLHNPGPKILRYQAWILPIRNEPIPSKDVDDVENLSAQVIFSIGGTEQCAGSPAPWKNEPLSQIKIPLGATKDLILIIGESPTPGGLWQVIGACQRV